MRQDFGYYEGDQLGRVVELTLWKRFLTYLTPRRGQLATAVVMSLAITGASLATPFIMRIAVDRYIVDTAKPLELRLERLGILAGLILLVISFELLANFLQVILLERIGQQVMHRMRQDLFRHLLGLDMSFFHRNPVGRLVTRITNDIQNMHEMFTSVVVTVFNDFIRMAGILAVLFWMDWRLALVSCALIPPIVAGTAWFNRRARDAFRQIRTRLARINAFIQEAVSGIAVVQLFRRVDDFLSRFRELNHDYFDKSLYQIKLFGVFMPFIEVLNTTAVALIIWYGGGRIIEGHMTLGVFVAFLSYMRLFFQPLREFSQKYSIVQSAMASAERIFQLLDTPAAVLPPVVPVTPTAGAGAIAFNNVTFSYEEGRPVIRNLSLAVAPGETIAIVGATGSGKTTVINLLERFHDPDQGEILLDGVDLRMLDPLHLRQRIGLVMQDVFIVAGSIRENILLNTPVPEEAMAAILEKSQLAVFLASLPDGLDTRIGEGGLELSTGQKQLLAFARVLAWNPDILILDEATSNIDSETEMLIERAIASTMADRTSLVIAHRLSTIRRADRILVMEQGHIAEAGDHETLIARRGLYFRLQTLSGNSCFEPTTL